MADNKDGPHGPIIDELLCFILHKWGNIDVDTLVKLCTSAFEEKEIEASKDILFNLLCDKNAETTFKKRRSVQVNKSKSVNFLHDICQLLEENGSAKLPNFVALDLGKLPPITFDNLDVTVLLNKIEKLSCTVNFLKDGMNSVTESQQNVFDLTMKLDSRVSKLESTEEGSKDEIKDESSDLKVDDSEKIMDGTLDELPLLCQKCDSRFKTSTELSEHDTNEHPNLNVLSCKECVFQSDSQEVMDNHVISHKPYACTICGFRSASSDELGIHMTTHMDERPFPCDKCGGKFVSETDLESHMTEHSGENLNACYVCDAKFSTHDELKAHVLIHKEEKPRDEQNKPKVKKSDHKPYACPECDYRAATQAQCKTHMAVHNTSGVKIAKPNACFVCDDRFATLEDLKLHMTIHTDEKTFTCKQCDYRCNDELTLKHHMDAHIGEVPDITSDAQFPQLGEMGDAWSLDDLARKHFVDTLFNKDGWSRPFLNGKQMKTKDMVKSNPVAPRNTNYNNRGNNNNQNNNNNSHNKNRNRGDAIIGTGKGSNVAIQNKKYHASLFATRFDPSTNAATVKRDLEANLLRLTGTKHIVTVEKLPPKYDHYVSFKISCACDNTAVLKNSEIWPENILVRWWRSTRKGNNNNNH